MKVIPLEDRVLILQDAAKEMEGELHVPIAAQIKPAIGTIVAIGPGKSRGSQENPIAYLVEGQFFSSREAIEFKEGQRIIPVYTMALKVGDNVGFAQYAGVSVEHDGKDHLLMRVSDIIFINEAPKE